MFNPNFFTFSVKKTFDESLVLRSLDIRQRIVFTLFRQQNVVTSAEVAQALDITERTARAICLAWVKKGFLIIINPAKKNRTYALSPAYDIYTQ